MSTLAISILALTAVLGILILGRPRWHRIGIVAFGVVALLSVFVVGYMGPRLALAQFKAAGGTYSNDLALFLASVYRIGLVFYALIVLCVTFLGFIAFRLTSKGREA